MAWKSEKNDISLLKPLGGKGGSALPNVCLRRSYFNEAGEVKLANTLILEHFNMEGGKLPSVFGRRKWDLSHTASCWDKHSCHGRYDAAFAIPFIAFHRSSTWSNVSVEEQA